MRVALNWIAKEAGGHAGSLSSTTTVHSAQRRCRRREVDRRQGASTSATRPIRCPRRRTFVGPAVPRPRARAPNTSSSRMSPRPRPRWPRTSRPTTRRRDRLPQLVRRRAVHQDRRRGERRGHILIQPFAPRRPTNRQQGGRGLSQGEGGLPWRTRRSLHPGSYTMAVMVKGIEQAIKNGGDLTGEGIRRCSECRRWPTGSSRWGSTRPRSRRRIWPRCRCCPGTNSFSTSRRTPFGGMLAAGAGDPGIPVPGPAL